MTLFLILTILVILGAALPSVYGNKYPLLGDAQRNILTLISVFFYIYVIYCWHNQSLSLSLWIYALLVVALLGAAFSTKPWIHQNSPSGRITLIFFVLLTPFLALFMLEGCYTSEAVSISFHFIFANALIIGIFELACYLLFNNIKVAIILSLMASIALGTLQYFVLKYRGLPLLPADIFSASTALAVVHQYKYEANDKLLMFIYLFLAVCAILKHTELSKSPQTLTKRCFQLLCCSVLLLLGYNTYKNWDFEQGMDMSLNEWSPTTTYEEYGFPVTFLAYAQRMNIQKPDGYSKDKADELLLDYFPEISPVSQKPTIIAIMNESFCDLRVYGDLGNSENVMSVWDSLDNYVEKGDCYVSVLGGGTANSEFEFLTSDSYANLPSATAYMQYSLKSVPNLARILKTYGYKTLAIHPGEPAAWNRTQVYQDLGFERFLTKRDFPNATQVNVGPSDFDCYQKIISEYESMDGPSFIFNVTIQNHSGYYPTSLEGIEEISYDEIFIDYYDAFVYQNLIKNSNQALISLLDYFEQVAEPVIICFFGDHQPNLTEGFKESILGSDFSSLEDIQKQYTTKYFIWANFDVPTAYWNTELASVNYLAARVLYYAGLPVTNYMNFLLEMSTEISAINSMGYMAKDGTWYSLDDKSKYQELLYQYELLQYNSLFDDARTPEFYYIHD